MKTIAFVITIFTLLVITAFGAEQTVSLDRCRVLNSSIDQTTLSNIAMQFDMPDGLSGREVHFAELVIEIPAMALREDSLFELLLYAIVANWEEETIDYASCNAITDSVLIGTSLVKLGASNEFRIDITPYVKDVIAGTKANHGFLARANLLGENNLRLPENQRDSIRNSARIRIVYK